MVVIQFKDQKPTLSLFGGYGTNRIAKKTSRDNGKQEAPPFLKIFRYQLQFIITETEPKRDEITPEKNMLNSH